MPKKDGEQDQPEAPEKCSIFKHAYQKNISQGQMKRLDTGESGKTKRVLQNRKLLQHSRGEISSCSRKLAPLFELIAASCHGGAGKAAEMPYFARLVSRFTFHPQRPGTSYDLPFPVPELTKSADVCSIAAMFHFRFLSLWFFVLLPVVNTVECLFDFPQHANCS